MIPNFPHPWLNGRSDWKELMLSEQKDKWTYEKDWRVGEREAYPVLLRLYSV